MQSVRLAVVTGSQLFASLMPSPWAPAKAVNRCWCKPRPAAEWGAPGSGAISNSSRSAGGTGSGAGSRRGRNRTAATNASRIAAPAAYAIQGRRAFAAGSGSSVSTGAISR